jgi:hypothetical protein
MVRRLAVDLHRLRLTVRNSVGARRSIPPQWSEGGPEFRSAEEHPGGTNLQMITMGTNNNDFTTLMYKRRDY